MKPVSYRRVIHYIATTPSIREFDSGPLKECVGVRMAAVLFDQPESRVAEDVEATVKREKIEGYVPYTPYR